MRSRIRQIVEAEGLSLADLEARTGISAYKWGNLLTGKQRVNEDHIAALHKLYPQYTYWLVTGEILEQNGHEMPRPK